MTNEPKRWEGRLRRRASRIVITGGPGAGKTTLLLALQKRGYTIVGDSPRTIIQDRSRRGLSPRPSEHELAHETLRMDVAHYEHHAATPGWVFFDRSILDALCGLDCIAPLNDQELSVWLAKYPYGSKVFLLPPWKAIYVTDDERDHTFEHAESVYGVLQTWYRRLDRYQVIEVPKVPVEDRCTWVLQALATSDA
jgi:predicted ATPase